MENPEKESEIQDQMRSLEAELERRRLELRRPNGLGTTRMIVRILGILFLVGGLLFTLWMMQQALDAMRAPDRSISSPVGSPGKPDQNSSDF